MSTQLLEIQSKELKFIFEPKKQSSCSVRLANNTQDHVAFKVKTTSPKKYCVRPNVGVVLPQSACDFTVIMQAHQIAPPDMVCKDKFLIQSTIVPPGTTDEDITPGMFAKDSGKYIEENKLRVALISPPTSPGLSPVSPINGGSKEWLFQSAEPAHEKSSANEELFHGISKLRDENEESEKRLSRGTSKVNAENGIIEDGGLVYRASKLKDQSRTSFDIFSPQNMVPEYFGLSKVVYPEDANAEESKPPKYTKLEHAEEVDLKTVTNVEELKLSTDIDEMKSKLHELELNLSKAQVSISRLIEERKNSTQEIKILQQRLTEVIKPGRKQVEDGFPPLFLCMVALICIILGYITRH